MSLAGMMKPSEKVFRRIVHVHHVNTHHLHTGIEEEDAAGQYQVVEIRQVGEETLRHIHIVMASGRNVNDAQKDEQTCRYDRADHTSPFADFADPVHTFQGNERSDPVDGQYDYQGEYLVRRKGHVVRFVHADKGDRYGAEGQYRRVPDRRFDPLKPDGEKSRACAVRFADPAEYTALFVGEHGRQLRSHHGRRDQEDDCGEQVVECRR